MQQRPIYRLLACLALVCPAASADTVVLRNGFRLEAARIEVDASRMRLFTAGGGWIDVAKDQVRRVERQAPMPSAPATASQPSQPPAQQPDTPAGIERIAASEGLPGSLLQAVAYAESGLQQDAVSEKGAIGIMQLMPGTAAELGVNPHSPQENLMGGARYLRAMLERYAGDEEQLVKALAAYNAGPGRVEEYGGLPPFAETNAYVAKVLEKYLELDRNGE